MSKPEDALPHWDLSTVYPSLESIEFRDGFESTLRAIDQLGELFDEYHITLQEDPPPLDDTLVRVFETVMERYNDVLKQTRTLNAYIDGFVTTDSRNELAQAKSSELRQRTMRLSLLDTRFTAWIGSLDAKWEKRPL